MLLQADLFAVLSAESSLASDNLQAVAAVQLQQYLTAVAVQVTLQALQVVSLAVVSAHASHHFADQATLHCSIAFVAIASLAIATAVLSAAIPMMVVTHLARTWVVVTIVVAGLLHQ